MTDERPKPEDSGELMYVKCAYCGKWVDVKPGQMNWVSHGLCDECLRKELEKVKGSGATPPGDKPEPTNDGSAD